jgi:hypothetical protein
VRAVVKITLERITERHLPSRMIRKPSVTGRAVGALFMSKMAAKRADFRQSEWYRGAFNEFLIQINAFVSYLEAKAFLFSFK